MNLTVARALSLWKAPEEPQMVSVIDGYVLGDHYQSGSAWVGPVPSEGTIEDRLKDVLTSNGVMMKAVKRALMAVIGSEPYWDVTVKQNENLKAGQASKFESLINEANDLLTNYFDNSRLQKIFVQAAFDLICKNRSSVRIYLPTDALLEEDDYNLADVSKPENSLDTATEQEVEFANIEAALNCLAVQVLPLASGGFLRDESKRIVGAFYRYEKTNSKTETEVSYIDRNTGKTIIEILDASGAILPDLKMKIDLAGKTTVYEIGDAGLITADIISQQKAIDHNETMLLMNNSYAGFRERLFLNAEPPTMTVEKNGKKIEVEAPLNVGPGTSQFIQGTAIEDSNTRELKGFSTPGIVYKDPVDQSGLIKSIQHNEAQILKNMFQAHILISGDAMASGTSRTQAVQDHVSSLRLIEQELNSLIRWCLETLLHYAAFLINEEGKYKALKVVARCIITAVLPTPEERTKLIEEYNAGLRSRETTMQLLGVEDTASEILKMEKETEKRLSAGQQEIVPGDNQDDGTIEE
jgi:hypothetical protein